MKILFVRTTNKISGSETYNVNLLGGLEKDVDNLELVFLTNFPALITRTTNQGISTQKINFHFNEIGTKKDLLRILYAIPLFYCLYAKSIIETQRGRKFDVVCLQSMTEKVFLTGWLKVFGYKVVWIEHGPLFISQVSQIIKSLYVIMSFFVDGIIAVSKDTKKDLIRGGVKKEKITNLYIGIDTKQFFSVKEISRRKLKAKLGINPKALVIGFLGSIDSKKGIEHFVLIANNLCKTDYEFHFMVIGGGPMFARVKDSVKKIKTAFTFTGFIQDPVRYLQAVDILLFPTRHQEGISIALLEAQAMGIPVVATDMGGNSEIISHGKDGFLYNLNDRGLMESSLLQLAIDKSLRTRIGISAKKNVEMRFNIKKQSVLFYHYFKDICGR